MFDGDGLLSREGQDASEEGARKSFYSNSSPKLKMNSTLVTFLKIYMKEGCIRSEGVWLSEAIRKIQYDINTVITPLGQ